MPASIPKKVVINQIRTKPSYNIKRGILVRRKLPKVAAQAEQFNAEQLAFLERKKRSKETGEVILPQDRLCKYCYGGGQVVCNQCEGSGTNDKDIMITDRTVNVYQASGLINVASFFVRGGPCWLCRGAQKISCKECQGTGIAEIEALLSE
eukprot:TRINITY_DN3154_c0_g2_i2.p2 TRINITY_DN3154_c0_g2~~TRINITY_DN3154_c0_g2_i2.p2  ORF type:complete len:160 (+),score=9.83 TRINITY_DN3154_c0_g2_i2:29-481(+)